MNVRDVMAVDVMAVTPDHTIDQVATLFAGRRINGAPVIADGELVGIVTSTDLMRAAEDVSVRVGDVMSCDVVTVSEGMRIAEATRLLARRGLHRAPVVRGPVVVGMLTRTDLLRPHLRTDTEIHAAIEGTVSQTLGLDHAALHVRVLDGVVFLEGSVPGRREHGILMQLAGDALGVVKVIDHIRVTSASPGPTGDGPMGPARISKAGPRSRAR